MPLEKVTQLFPGGFDAANGGGDDGGMEELKRRVDKLERLAEKAGEQLVVIERDVAVMRSNYCTREDMHKEFGSLTWKLVAVIVLAQFIPAMPALLRGLKLIT